MDSRIRDMIGINPSKGVLPCPVAHYIASSLGVSPKDVGDEATSMKVKLDLCQLGVFGYGRKNTKTGYKILGRHAASGPEGLLGVKAAAKEGRIPCKDLWDIAASSGVTRPEAGNAADSLGIKVSPCQLGAF